MDISEKNIKRFKSAVRSLNKVIRDCKKENSKCFAYHAGNTMHLMSGDALIGEDGVHESVVAEETLDSTGGDW